MERSLQPVLVADQKNLLTCELVTSQVVELPFLQIAEKSGFSIIRVNKGHNVGSNESVSISLSHDYTTRRRALGSSHCLLGYHDSQVKVKFPSQVSRISENNFYASRITAGMPFTVHGF